MRAKPVHVRTKYAFFVSSGITIIIAILWLLSFTLTTPVVSNTVIPQAPLTSLSASVGSVYDSIKEIFVGGNKTQYSADSVEVSPGKI